VRSTLGSARGERRTGAKPACRRVDATRREAGQATVEFGISSILLLLIFLDRLQPRHGTVPTGRSLGALTRDA